MVGMVDKNLVIDQLKDIVRIIKDCEDIKAKYSVKNEWSNQTVSVIVLIFFFFFLSDLGEVCLRGEGKYSHKDIQNKLKKAS